MRFPDFKCIKSLENNGYGKESLKKNLKMVLIR